MANKTMTIGGTNGNDTLTTINLGDSKNKVVNLNGTENINVNGTELAEYVRDALGIKDYITEQGTQSATAFAYYSDTSHTLENRGTWTYRKWNSGKYECWYYGTFDSISINKQWGTLYESGSEENGATGINIEFPITFKSIQNTFYSITSNGPGVILEIDGDASTSKTANMYVVRPNTYGSDNVKYYYQVYAIGTI